MRKLVGLAFTFLLFCITAIAQRTILHCGKLIDVAKGETLSSYSIIIEGNKIVEVRAGYVTAAANDKIIDLKNRTVMPG
jgi:imidazolonepropionase-like amidohydrolase